MAQHGNKESTYEKIKKFKSLVNEKEYKIRRIDVRRTDENQPVGQPCEKLI